MMYFTGWRESSRIRVNCIICYLKTNIGAISLAIEDVTRQKILPDDHTLDMLVAETYGEEEESILQTAKLWTLNVSAYIGPQESCVHEARMAAVFRLPMISYVSRRFT